MAERLQQPHCLLFVPEPRLPVALPGWGQGVRLKLPGSSVPRATNVALSGSAFFSPFSANRGRALALWFQIGSIPASSPAHHTTHEPRGRTVLPNMNRKKRRLLSNILQVWENQCTVLIRG